MSKRRGSEAPQHLHARWLEYLEAAYAEIIHAFWNRKVFRAIGAMFDTNPELRKAPGSGEVWNWLRDVYAHYAVMLVRRELDTQSGVLSLTKMLLRMEIDHAMLRVHAQGRPVPRVTTIRADRLALERKTRKVVDYSHRLVAHRTPPGAPTITFADIDNSLRAIRSVLIKYRGVLKGTSLLAATPTPQFDWLAPFTMAWLSPGFQEPEAEEERPMTNAARRRNREQRQRLGFDRN